MISADEIKRKATRKYGAFLTAAITGESFFPYNLPVGRLPSDYMAIKDAVANLIENSKATVGYGYTLSLETRKTKAYGNQSLPKRIFIETETDYLKLLKKESEFSRFRQDAALINAEIPTLTPWIERYPKQVVEHSGFWPDLLQVCHYFISHPRPNLYIRELPIPVHTKFVEQNKTVLRSLLEFLLPQEQILPVEAGQRYVFEKMFSLKYPESLIRLRILDPVLQQKYGLPTSDLSIVISEFNRLNLGAPNCLITENILSFLTLPALPDSIAILGGGYALSRLKNANWLSHCPILYWGDMDADGFRILSQLRAHFPQTQSMLMDMETYERFREFSVDVELRAPEVVTHLTAEEQTLYGYLSQHQQRLEQERISQDYVNQCLKSVARPPS